ncbi:hypothetical protein Ae201684P_005051 [Aphanomyces euteiches]|uniref:Lysine transporter LysE n=1 Tax=Aphanomyces euteiches TaxID=100861 RepID=A0A6G0X435_9STRA|nr:hypothetical protein Ae201684_008693 [Aphanomyces euteiches]KAH9085342.1 hypothetical protein Ae201684P_005051 [Aphanomyces euteiches]
MLPLYKKGLTYITVKRRHRNVVLIAAIATVVICLMLVGTYTMYRPLDTSAEETIAPASTTTVSPAVVIPEMIPRIPNIPSLSSIPATTDAPIPSPEETTAHNLWGLRYLLPISAGFIFGFLGSIPIAGPTSAMVLKMGIQGKYWEAQTVALGGAAAEATYAGVAYWGFGSFLVGVGFLLPLSKILGACMLLIVGIVFLRLEVKPQIESDARGHTYGASALRAEFAKNLLLGFTMSGFNPALLATYTGALASVYHTGYLEFTLFLALFFGVGTACGISTWFYILLSLLKTYKQRLKNQTIGAILRGMGMLLITLGLYCTKSAFDYFFP